jgi:hypothetical protein
MFSGLNCVGGAGTAPRPFFNVGLRLDEDRAGEGGADEGVPAGDGTLDEAARREHEYLEGRLREELGREPTEEELNEWLRRHTEGY